MNKSKETIECKKNAFRGYYAAKLKLLGVGFTPQSTSL